MTTWVLVLAALLAFANGANDNSKGVATLVGYGAASPRAALAWAAGTTALGAWAGALFGTHLLSAFRAGFVGGGDGLGATFYAAALAGACAWVFFATWASLPVSTTHAILGGLVGAGLLEVGASTIGWSWLIEKTALPLLLSPLVALTFVFLAGPPLARLVRRSQPRCLCALATLEPTLAPHAAHAAHAAHATTAASGRLSLVTGEVAVCALHSPAAMATGTDVATAVHWGTSGMVGFARGWNDTPKIAALALVALPASSGRNGAFLLVASAMALGGLLAGRRVLATLAEKITPLPLGESLAASGASALLVGLASWRGLPVSTTHVTTGGIVGAGLAHSAGTVRWGVVREIAFSWIVTLPAAAAVAAALSAALRTLLTN